MMQLMTAFTECFEILFAIVVTIFILVVDDKKPLGTAALTSILALPTISLNATSPIRIACIAESATLFHFFRYPTIVASATTCSRSTLGFGIRL